MIIYNDILLETNILLKEFSFLGFIPYHQSDSLSDQLLLHRYNKPTYILS